MNGYRVGVVRICGLTLEPQSLLCMPDAIATIVLNAHALGDNVAEQNLIVAALVGVNVGLLVEWSFGLATRFGGLPALHWLPLILLIIGGKNYHSGLFGPEGRLDLVRSRGG